VKKITIFSFSDINEKINSFFIFLHAQIGRVEAEEQIPNRVSFTKAVLALVGGALMAV
jgi:hypothetical protein